MPSFDEISSHQLSRLIGLPDCPRLVDVRPAAVARLLPTARRLDAGQVQTWSQRFRGHRAVVYCHDGGAVSQGAAAWLRSAGAEAEVLTGGFEAWAASGGLLVRPERIPDRDENGSTVWVTRARPKVVRIACPWLIRRFLDPDARFLFVDASEVASVAERFKAVPFDTGHGIWHDRGELCTFDVMLAEFGLDTEPLQRLARVVRGADTGRLDLAPQAAGLLAASLGFSRMHGSDLDQLDAAMALYDSFYRWSRDASTETHD